jgi:hypothetical protein
MRAARSAVKAGSTPLTWYGDWYATIPGGDAVSFVAPEWGAEKARPPAIALAQRTTALARRTSPYPQSTGRLTKPTVSDLLAPISAYMISAALLSTRILFSTSTA